MTQHGVQARSDRSRPAARAAEAGVYAKGKSRASEIVDAAISLLIERGYHNLSMRGVAESAGVRLGNLQHYFPTKDDLVQAMLDRVLEDYLQRFDEIHDSIQDPEQEFAALVGSVIRDLNQRKTTVFFPELWSLSNHEKQVTRFMDHMYEKYRSVLCSVIARINPSLQDEQVRRLALFVCASIEGHTVFIGHRKPWRNETESVVSLATQSFLWLIREGHVPEGPIGKPTPCRTAA